MAGNSLSLRTVARLQTDPKPNPDPNPNPKPQPQPQPPIPNPKPDQVAALQKQCEANAAHCAQPWGLRRHVMALESFNPTLPLTLTLTLTPTLALILTKPQP